MIPGGGRTAPLLLCFLLLLACSGEPAPEPEPEPGDPDAAAEPAADLETNAAGLAGTLESAEDASPPDKALPGTEDAAALEPRDTPEGAAHLPDGQEPAGGFLAPENQQRILLFFPSASNSELIPEQRIIFLTDTLTSRVKQAVSELIAGPITQGLLAPFPRQTSLEDVFLPGTGVAVIDLGREVLALPQGTEWEQAALYSLVDTLVHNFAEIHKVQILVQGQEIDTLAGHLDTSHPLGADMHLVDWIFQRLLDEDGNFVPYGSGPTLPPDWVEPEPPPATETLPDWAPDVPVYEPKPGDRGDDEPRTRPDEPTRLEAGERG